MKLLPNKHIVKGIFRAPASKSVAQRAIMLAALSQKEVKVSGLTWSEDIRSVCKFVRLFAEVLYGDDFVSVIPGAAEKNVNCGESGFVLRAGAALAATLPYAVTLTCHGTLMLRPIDMVIEPLERCGVEVVSRMPLTVRGPLRSAECILDGGVSSQFLSGLLMALPTVQGSSSVNVTNLMSKPYVNLTIDVIRRFGGNIVVDRDLSTFIISGGQQYSCRGLDGDRQEFVVEGDWSAAAALLVAGAISGDVTVNGVLSDSLQPDRAIVEVLERSGADVVLHSDGVHVKSANDLRSFTFDATHSPDLIPVLCAFAMACHGKSKIYGAGRLLYKESNRALAIVSELNKLGGKISLDEDLLVVTGGERLIGGQLSTHGDHRIAMAIAVASLIAEEPIVIDNPGVVAKSYPEFFRDFYYE